MEPTQRDVCSIFGSPQCVDDTAGQHLFWLLGHPEFLLSIWLGLGLAALVLLVWWYRRTPARSFRFTVPVLWVLGFSFLSIAGGSADLLLANTGVDQALHDTYYVVAHFNYLLSIASVFAIFAGWYHWFPRISGRAYSELWGKMHFWLTFIGSLMMLLPLYFFGLVGMPHYYVDYPEAFAYWNWVSAIGGHVAAAGTICLFVSMLWRFVGHRGQGPESP
jgi:cytochrome c oxidase subunit 1